jgi:hypothetical protein
MEKAAPTRFGEFNLSQPTQDTLLIAFSGRWEIGSDLPSAQEALNKIETSALSAVFAFATQNLSGWDTALLRSSSSK